MKNSRHEDDAVSAELKSLFDTLPSRSRDEVEYEYNLGLSAMGSDEYDALEDDDEDLPF
ncbi:MAG: hypothetical protein ABF629_10135 [Sporolactobacillus sp.]